VTYENKLKNYVDVKGIETFEELIADLYPIAPQGPAMSLNSNVSLDPETTDVVTELLSTLVSEGQGMADSINGSVNSLNSNMEKLLKNIRDEPPTFRMKHEFPFTSILDWFKRNGKHVLLLVYIFVASLVAYNRPTYRPMLGVLSTLVALAYVGQSTVQYLIEKFSEITDLNTPKIVPQGGIPTLPIVNCAMFGIFASIFRSMKKDTILEMVEEFGKKSMYLRRMHDGMQFTVDFFLSILQECASFITNWIGGEKICIKSDPFWEVKEYMLGVAAICKDFYADPLKDVLFAATVEQKIAEGEGLRKKLTPLRDSTADMASLSTTLQTLSKIKSELATRSVSVSGQRPEPVLITLTGPPGVGKTQCMLSLWPRVTANIIPDRQIPLMRSNRGAFVKAHDQGDGFYSGYNGQLNYLVDELGFLRDVPGTKTVWSDLIQWINMNPMSLNMASLHEKGTTYFRSELIWATTNRAHFNSLHSIEEPQAVYRRMANTFMCAVKPEFVSEATRNEASPWDRLVDFNLVKEAGMGPRDFGFLEFFKVNDLKNGTFDDTPIGYEELVDFVIDTYRTNKTKCADLLSAIDEDVESILDRRSARMKNRPQAGFSCNVCPACNKSVKFPAGTSVPTALEAMQIPFKLKPNGVAEYTFGVNNTVTVSELIGLVNQAKDDLQIDDYRGCIHDPHITLDDVVRSWLINNLANIAYDIEEKQQSVPMAGVGPLSSIMRFLAGFAVSYAIGFAFGKFLKWMFPPAPIEPVFSEQSDMPYGFKKVPLKSFRKSNRVVPQIGEDPNAGTLASKLVTKNIWRFVIKTSINPNAKHEGCVLALQNNVVLMPDHYIGYWANIVNGSEEEGIPPDPNAEITFHCSPAFNKNSREFKERFMRKKLIDLLDFVNEDGSRTGTVFNATEDPNDDAVVFLIPGITGPNILKLFRSKKDKLPPNHKGMLVVLNSDIRQVFHSATYKRAGLVAYDSGVQASSDAIYYDVITRTGDCGSPFLVYDKGNESKIASIHVGGDRCTKGIGAVVNREFLEIALMECCVMWDQLVDVGPSSAHPDVVNMIQCGEIADLGGLPVECEVKPIPQMRKSRLVKSPIHGKIEGRPPKKAQAMLAPRGGIDPLENARSGYGLSSVSPGDALLRAATDDFLHEFYTAGSELNDDFRRVLSFEEAVMGIPGLDYADGINRKTSPGWPMKHVLPGGSKKAAFGDGGWEFDSDSCLMIKDHVDFLEKTILEGKRPFIVNNHFLKDELRPLDRVVAGKTRLISSSDLIAAIALRKQTLMFSVYAMQNRIHNGMAVGINPMGDDWSQLAKRHGSNSPLFRVIAGDYGGFDKTLSVELIWAMKRVLLSFYRDEGKDSQKIRDALINELAQSRHICIKSVYQWMGGNPSGNILTVFVNCVGNCILVRCAIVKIVEPQCNNYNQAMEILKERRGAVKITTFGDDNLISVMKALFDDITQQALTEALSELGMVYTDENKSTDDVGDRTLSECNFLKRGFLKTHHCDKHRWMAPLAKETIFESVQWTKDHDIDLVHWKANVDHMLLELSAHGREAFQEGRKLFSEAVSSADVGKEVLLYNGNWHEAQDEWTCLSFEH
jgi:hypothetical protein